MSAMAAAARNHKAGACVFVFALRCTARGVAGMTGQGGQYGGSRSVEQTRFRGEPRAITDDDRVKWTRFECTTAKRIVRIQWFARHFETVTQPPMMSV